MPAPAVKPTTADQWTPVAIDVLTGQVHRMVSGPVYLQTYRPTGDPAPTLRAEGVPAFIAGAPENIISNEPIDVYIWSDDTGREDPNGSVRVDV